MKNASIALLVIVALGLAATPSVMAQNPDVIVAAIHNNTSYTAIGNIDAFSIGTTSCNIGVGNLLWIANGTQHPVISQNMYRVWDGRLDHIGQSWLKHAFGTINNGICGTCPGGLGQQLPPMCSDPYGAGLNGSQGGLGPKFEVNAATGGYLWPFTGDNLTGNSIYKRLQVNVADLNSANFPGARYFVESQYVTEDDDQAGNALNNASYRECTFSGGPTDYAMNSFSAANPTVQQQPAFKAWKAVESSVEEREIDIPNDGRINVGFNAIDNGDGTFRYEYAIHNFNSDRSIQSVTIPMGGGATVTNIGFNDVDYHSGEPYDLTDWTSAFNGTSIIWNTDLFTTNANANAIRWGTTYSFRFTSDVPPSGDVIMNLFKPGTPNAVVASFTPPVPPPFAINVNTPIPDVVVAQTAFDIDITTVDLADADDPSTALFFVQFDGAGFGSIPLTYNGGDSYTASFPPLLDGTDVEFYFTIDAMAGGTIASPLLAPINVYSFTVSDDFTILTDNMETGLGWTVVDDAGLIDGGWDRGTPLGGGDRGDPILDSDGSGQCWLTDNVDGNSDVDGGPTTLTSPAYDLSTFADPYISFDYWWDNNTNTALNDSFIIEISDDGTNWVNLETQTTSTEQWNSRNFRVRDFVDNSATVQVRFIADDSPNDSIIEAGVDNLAITDSILINEAIASGNIGATMGGPYDILLLNGSNGGPLRTVQVGIGEDFTLFVLQPPFTVGPKDHAIFANVGIPTALDVFEWPFAIGPQLFEPCVAPDIVVTNTLLTPGCEGAIGATNTPFSFTFVGGLPFPIDLTLQGIVFDENSPSGLFGVTNGIVLRIQ